MRTTVIFPPELMRAAKARSAELGESLKTLLTRAVEAEIGRETRPRGSRPRVSLPLFGRAAGPLVSVSNADLEQALADVDGAGVSGQRRAASRPSGRKRR